MTTDQWHLWNLLGLGIIGSAPGRGTGDHRRADDERVSKSGGKSSTHELTPKGHWTKISCSLSCTRHLPGLRGLSMLNPYSYDQTPSKLSVIEPVDPNVHLFMVKSASTRLGNASSNGGCSTWRGREQIDLDMKLEKKAHCVQRI